MCISFFQETSLQVFFMCWTFMHFSLHDQCHLLANALWSVLIWLQVLIPVYTIPENLKEKTIRDRINQLVSESFWTQRHMNTEGVKGYFTLKQPLNETLQRNSNAVLLKPTLISLNLFAHCIPNLENTWNSLAYTLQMVGFISSYGSYPPKPGNTSHSLEMTVLYSHKGPDNTYKWSSWA